MSADSFTLLPAPAVAAAAAAVAMLPSTEAPLLPPPGPLVQRSLPCSTKASLAAQFVSQALVALLLSPSP